MTQDNCTETPMCDHVEHFWRLLAENKVRILIDMHRPDSFGGLGHWDSSSFPDDVAKALVAERRGATPPADMEGAVRMAVDGALRFIDRTGNRAYNPDYFTAIIRAALSAVSALQRGENPRVTDNDQGEITVDLDGKELRGWSYDNDDQRRMKMLCAREYVEGWCDGRGK